MAISQWILRVDRPLAGSRALAQTSLWVPVGRALAGSRDLAADQFMGDSLWVGGVLLT